MSFLFGRRARWAGLGAIVGALVVGGIAWADIPDSGVINGCYAKDGTLRVIDTSAGQSCDTKKESALSWNQTGLQGPTGPSGAPGPGATTFTATVPADEQDHVLATLANGVRVIGRCTPPDPAFGVGAVVILLNASLDHLQVSGTKNEDRTVEAVDADGVTNVNATSAGISALTDFDVLARDKSVGKFARIDVHGIWEGTACAYWGMIIPSS